MAVTVSSTGACVGSAVGTAVGSAVGAGVGACVGSGVGSGVAVCAGSAFILVLAGGIGNLIDRVLNGEVVDYINPLFIDFAVFNFADICVCVGVALWVLVILLEEVDDKPSKER